MSRQFWDKAALDPNVRDNWICDKNISDEQCMSALGGLQEGTIIDLGCGIGRLTSLVKKKYPKSFVAGVDISPKMLKLAEKAGGWAESDLSPSHYPFYYLTDGESIPYVSNKANTVFSLAMFQHIPDDNKLKYIDEAYRVLKPGGMLRFQFVTEGQEGEFNHPTKLRVMLSACKKFSRHEVEESLIFPEWTWITAWK